MKVRLILITSALLLLSACVPPTSSCCGGGYKDTTVTTSCASQTTVGPSCNCVDPACFGDNNCLGRGECCRVFGNIGGAHDSGDRASAFY